MSKCYFCDETESLNICMFCEKIACYDHGDWRQDVDCGLDYSGFCCNECWAFGDDCRKEIYELKKQIQKLEQKWQRLLRAKIKRDKKKNGE